MGILALNYGGDRKSRDPTSVTIYSYNEWDVFAKQYQGIDHSSTCDPLNPLVSAEMKKIVPPQPAPLGREEGAMSWEAWAEKLRAK